VSPSFFSSGLGSSFLISGFKPRPLSSYGILFFSSSSFCFASLSSFSFASFASFSSFSFASFSSFAFFSFSALSVCFSILSSAGAASILG